MKTPISQSTAKTNAKKYNDYFNNNYQTYKPKMRKPQKHYVVALPPDTDMVEVRSNLKKVKQTKGKTANALIAAYILKLAK